MKCNKCGFVNGNKVEYCDKCGEKLVKKKAKFDIGLILIFLFGIICFSFVEFLAYKSLATLNNKESGMIEEKGNINIIGVWSDNDKTNLLKIHNNFTYEWFKDYKNDKTNSLSGKMDVKTKNEALSELNLTIEEVKQKFNLSDIAEQNIYFLKLYSSNEMSNYYNKVLCVEKNKKLYLYDYNDDSVLQFSKNK